MVVLIATITHILECRNGIPWEQCFSITQLIVEDAAEIAESPAYMTWREFHSGPIPVTA
jgi:hypothetical protein